MEIKKEKKKERKRYTHALTYIVQIEEYQVKHAQSYYSNTVT